MATEYLVQEEDGTSRFILEEGDGFLILEESTAAEEILFAAILT